VWVGLRHRRGIAPSLASFALAIALFAAPAGRDVAVVGALPQPAVETAPLPPLVTPAELAAPPAETFDYYAALAAVPDEATTAPDVVPLPVSRPSGIKAVSLPMPPAVPAEPFADVVIAIDTGGLVQKWRAVTRGLRAERHVLDRCRADAANCPAAAKRFLAIVDAARRVDGELRIAQINRAINLNIRGATDRALYGVEELWATPLQTFANNAGDCEDYAIAKYAALREIGVPAERLRLVVVRDNKAKDYHAVTAVRSGERWMILDNRTLAIRADSEVAEFDPLYVLDQAGVRRFDALAARHRRNAPIAVSSNEAMPGAGTPRL
jgi:predicted transglutaminase-like cysteine proteinase